MITHKAFQTICAEAYRAGAPRGSERAILREYLQCAVLSLLAERAGAESLAFIGGTSLRLLHGLDRFSEDLDFDNCGLSSMRPAELFVDLTKTLASRGLTARFRAKRQKPDWGGTLVIAGLLYDLHLSPNDDETMQIKLEYTTPTIVPERTTAVLNRFGFTAQLTTEPLPALCARKVLALLGRKRFQPRDLYDLHWFLSRRILPDPTTLSAYGIASYDDAVQHVIEKVHARASSLPQDARDLAPMLLDPRRAAVIRDLPQTIASLLRV